MNWLSFTIGLWVGLLSLLVPLVAAALIVRRKMMLRSAAPRFGAGGGPGSIPMRRR